jgi:hypothetical protein
MHPNSADSVRPRISVLILLAVVITTAGCSALDAQSTTPAGEPPTPTATPAPTAQSVSPTPEPTAPPTATQSPTPTRASPTTPTPTPDPYPDGYDDAGVVDPATAMTAHVEALTSRESYAVSLNATLLDENDSVYGLRRARAVETRSSEILVATRIYGDGVLQQYFANDTVYERYDPPSGDPRYRTTSSDYSVLEHTGSTVLRPSVANVTYADVDSLSRDGRTLYRYEGTRITDDRAVVPLFGGNIDRGAVSNFQATLVVDDAGIVQRLEYRATVTVDGGTRDLRVGFETIGIDETTVEEPEWTDRAEGSDGG